jgi:hypothetical protein
MIMLAGANVPASANHTECLPVQPIVLTSIYRGLYYIGPATVTCDHDVTTTDLFAGVWVLLSESSGVYTYAMAAVNMDYTCVHGVTCF